MPSSCGVSAPVSEWLTAASSTAKGSFAVHRSDGLDVQSRSRSRGTGAPFRGQCRDAPYAPRLPTKSEREQTPRRVGPQAASRAQGGVRWTANPKGRGDEAVAGCGDEPSPPRLCRQPCEDAEQPVVWFWSLCDLGPKGRGQGGGWMWGRAVPTPILSAALRGR